MWPSLVLPSHQAQTSQLATDAHSYQATTAALLNGSYSLGRVQAIRDAAFAGGHVDVLLFAPTISVSLAAVVRVQSRLQRRLPGENLQNIGKRCAIFE